MVSLIDALCSRHDVIVYDAESHACIIDGLRLHPGHRYVFKHNDVEDCEKQLQRATALIEKQGAGGILGNNRRCIWYGWRPGKTQRDLCVKRKI